MNKPFEKIITSDKYNLRYTWGNGAIDINKSIIDTHAQFGQDMVTERDFSDMIHKITDGVSSSALTTRRDPMIIQNICIWFPKFLNTKNVDCIIKCINTTSFDTLIDYIADTGYSFTTAQVKKLNTAGFLMLDNLDSMELSEFYSLFSNPVFRARTIGKIRDFVNIKDVPGIEAIIKELQNIIEKYKIVLDSKFLQNILVHVVGYNSTYNFASLAEILTIHKILHKLETPFDNSDIIWIIKSFNFKGSINYNEKNIFMIDIFKKILSYYDQIIDREFIMNLSFSCVKMLYVLYPDITIYDPVEDLFFFLEKFQGYDQIQFIDHLLANKYLVIDDFLLHIISLGYGNEKHLHSCIEANITMSEKIISNIYTFGSPAMLEVLFDNKFTPTLPKCKRMLNIDTLTYIMNNSMFVDGVLEEYILGVIDNNDTTYVDMPILSDNMYFQIYESLDSIDKEVFKRIKRDEYFNITTFIKYSNKLTKKSIEGLFSLNKWDIIVKLLHISNKYDYILSMIDLDMILKIPTYIGRIWFINNINNNENCINNAFYNPQFSKIKTYIHQNKDIKELLAIYECIDINKQRNDYIENKYIAKRKIFDGKSDDDFKKISVK